MYALKRLVRGLGSGHDAARQGFSLALAAALVRVPEIESLPALDMLEAALEVSKSTKVGACGLYSFLMLQKQHTACAAVLARTLHRRSPAQAARTCNCTCTP